MRPGKIVLLFSCLCLMALLSACSDEQITPRPQPHLNYSYAPNAVITNGIIGSVLWSENGEYLYYTTGDRRFRYDLNQNKRIPIFQNYQGLVSAHVDLTPRRPLPPRGRQYPTEPSPDGNWIAICENFNVILRHQQNQQEIPVTTDGQRKSHFGAANWIYGEELGQTHAMWWSPDSTKLVFYAFDETKVEDFYLTDSLTDIQTSILVESYPKAGAANPIAKLMIYDLISQTTVDLDCGPETDQYIYNVLFTPNGGELLFSRLNRSQNKLEIVAVDINTHRTRIVLTETQPTWQYDLPIMRFLDDGKRFIWQTEKTGWSQFELRHLDGSFICDLTSGDYVATDIGYLDESNGWLYYTALSDVNPLNQQLHKVRLDGSDQTRLTKESFLYDNLHISPDKKWLIAQQQTIDQPPQTNLYDIDGNCIAILAVSSDLALIETDQIVLPEIFTYKADDQTTDLYGMLSCPSNFDHKKKYPMILDIYSGPRSQPEHNIYQHTNPDTEYGFIIATIDNRGTPNRGKAFAAATWLRLGAVDVKDLADGVKFLRRRPYIDARCVGIVGHSYGGYLATMALLKYPDVFHAAVNRAGPTDWRNYDSVWTERYMRTPQQNPRGYQQASCLNYVDQLKGHLLIMHGLIDNNVHPTNAFQLIDALDRAGKTYECRFFPRADHNFAGRDTQWDFFYRHLIEPYLIY
ncbi:MAG: alpha/beta fold hydrolase [Planctomycetes bacterium]|nr:alpha/beta fold hydrolase [Planctomycetota bacterium]